ncbi:MAG: rhodanese-like domain-containing protein, partial [Dokdonia donghaensis]|nr:rhodanese-like domain-containing protein [Dokdonia donghaensis]
AGSLCVKNFSDANRSTLGNERIGYCAFKEHSKQEFMATILDGQPFIPSYFGYDVDTNKAGADNLETAISDIPFKKNTTAEGLIIDIRDEAVFKKGHLEGSINIQAISENAKFETWLGSIVQPEEAFTLVIATEDQTDYILNRVAKIGYEKQLKEIITLAPENLNETETLDLVDFKNNLDSYTIIDIRNESEVNDEQFFKNAHSHPLNNLRDTASTITTDKPIVVHCAGGYRSAAGSSIVQRVLRDAKVYDLSEAINDFKN